MTLSEAVHDIELEKSAAALERESKYYHKKVKYDTLEWVLELLEKVDGSETKVQKAELEEANARLEEAQETLTNLLQSWKPTDLEGGRDVLFDEIPPVLSRGIVHHDEIIFFNIWNRHVLVSLPLGPKVSVRVRLIQVHTHTRTDGTGTYGYQWRFARGPQPPLGSMLLQYLPPMGSKEEPLDLRLFAGRFVQNIEYAREMGFHFKDMLNEIARYNGEKP